MAINQNHLFEELAGVKCAIVEKNVSEDRAAFLKRLLEYNGYTVVMVPSPPPKAVPAGVLTEEAVSPQAVTSTYTLGVTDVVFNATNAIFGRLLKTHHGKVVTLAFWQQKESEPQDETPYYTKS